MSKWIHCRKCGHEYSSQLSRCPECSCVTVNFKLVSSIVASVAVLGVAVTGFVMGLNDNGQDKIAISSESSTVSKVTEKNESGKNDSSTKSDSTSSKFDIDAILSDIEKTAESSSVKTSSAEKHDTSESSNSEPTQAEYTPETGTEMLGDSYYITLPEYYLKYVYQISNLEKSGISFESYAYELDDEAKSQGFTSAKKNSDGSATRTITYNKYHAYLTDFIVSMNKYVFELEKQDYIEDIEQTNNFDSISIKLNKEAQDITITEYAQIVLLGCLGAEKQLSTVNSSNSCTVELIFPSGETETLSFPQCLN